MSAAAAPTSASSSGTAVVPSSSSSPKRFDISQLPSLKKDGMSVQEEALKRRKTCRFIEESGRVLKLPRVAVATAMVFFHRFYAKHAFSDHDRFEVAVASILLAAKTEESPKKLNHVIDECYKLKMRGMQAGRISAAGGAAAAAASSSSSGTLDPKGEEFTKLKERILLLERVLLHTIGFELSIDHPYKFLVGQIKKLVVQGRKLEFIPGSPPAKAVEKLSSQQVRDKMMNQCVQLAMNFANDSMHTSLCLQFNPHQIATATVYLAFQFAKVRPIDNKTDWLDLLDQPDVESLASIALQIIELMAERKGSDEATFNKLKRDLELLKNEKRARSDATPSSAAPDVKRARTN